MQKLKIWRKILFHFPSRIHNVETTLILRLHVDRLAILTKIFKTKDYFFIHQRSTWKITRACFEKIFIHLLIRSTKLCFEICIFQRYAQNLERSRESRVCIRAEFFVKYVILKTLGESSPMKQSRLSRLE